MLDGGGWRTGDVVIARHSVASQSIGGQLTWRHSIRLSYHVAVFCGCILPRSTFRWSMRRLFIYQSIKWERDWSERSGGWLGSESRTGGSQQRVRRFERKQRKLEPTCISYHMILIIMELMCCTARIKLCMISDFVIFNNTFCKDSSQQLAHTFCPTPDGLYSVVFDELEMLW